MRRVPVARLDDIPLGTMQMVQVDATDILIVHDAEGALHATQGICTHEYFELDKGFLTARCTCPGSIWRPARHSTHRPSCRSLSTQ